jgi:hypothetical protein
MLFAPASMYSWSFCSVGTTRPAAAMGATVTPGFNAKGAYAQVLSGANVARDVFGLQINFNSNAVSSAARDAIVDVGVDPSGGTSYSVLIPNLLASCASPLITGFGLNYFFPIWIKAGSSVAVAASVNNSTVGTLRCWMRIFGSPRDRTITKVGTKCIAYGITESTSSGVAVTPGTTSEGTWTQLGTIGSNDNPWFWQFGVGVNNATITALNYSADLGIGNATNKFVVDEQRLFQGTTNEQWYDNGVSFAGAYKAKAGDIIYGRMQCSGTPVTGISMAAYGVI